MIILSPQLVARLTVHRTAEAAAALKAGRPYDLKSFVLQREDGRPLSAAMVLRTWNRALRRASLPMMRFHDARHTVATTLIDRTGNSRLAADVLGHSDPSTTIRMYAHSTPKQHEQAAAILGEALGS